MISWKKAIGTAATATMLASLLLTAAVSSALAVTTCPNPSYAIGPYGSAIQYCTDVSTRPADGVSFITLDFVGNASHVVTNVQVSGGTFLGGSAEFATKSGASVTLTNSIISPDAKLYLAASTAGTATVTVSYSDGAQTVDSIQSFTFTSAASKVPSVANTANNIVGIAAVGTCSGADVVSSFAKAVAGTTSKAICTVVRDADGNTVTTGAKVKYTITGPGSIGTLGSGTITDTTSPFSAEIFSNGISGEATIKTTITYLNVDYALPDKTFTFYGDPKTADLSANVTSVVTGCDSDDTTGSSDCPIKQDAHSGLRLLVKDAAGTKVRDISGWTLSATVTPANLLTVNLAGITAYSSTYPGFAIPYTCGPDALQGTVAVKLAKGTDTVTSGTVSISCVDALASTAVGSFTVGAKATSLVPGGNTTITVTVKDDNGFPAADGTVVTAAANAGAIVSSDGTNSKKTSNGVADFTYLAPSTTGAATVTAFVSNAGGPNSVTLSIGGVTPPPSGVFAPTTSALGNTLTGPFTFATKIQAKGGYITWKVDGGATLANQTIQIWVYKKYTATGAWAGPTMLTTRKANASGVAYVNILSRGVLWLSLRPVLPATATAAAIWGPTSIGRWR